MSAEVMTPEQYIAHHLTHLQVNLNTMKVAPTHSFMAFNIDSLVIAWVLGFLFLGLFYFVARRAVAGTPGKLQNFVEWALESIQGLVAEVFHGKSKLIGPLSLTIFIWVFLMNFMDLLPVDIIPRFLELFGVKHFKVVPTADPMMTFGMSVTIFILVIFYNFKMKGLKGLGKEVFSKPFGWYLAPLNLAFRLLEEFVKKKL